MKSLQYIGKLESLGLCYSVDTFETCCKREVVQILWKSQRHLPCALSVIAQICTEFEIDDILLWDETLSRMAKLRMVSRLESRQRYFFILQKLILNVFLGERFKENFIAITK